MVTCSSEAYLSFPFLSTSGVPGLLLKLRLREMCVVTLLKMRQSQTVQEKTALQAANSLLCYRVSSSFSCHGIVVGIVEQLFSLERWNTYFEWVYSSSCDQDAEAQVVLLCWSVSSSMTFGYPAVFSWLPGLVISGEICILCNRLVHKEKCFSLSCLLYTVPTKLVLWYVTS